MRIVVLAAAPPDAREALRTALRVGVREVVPTAATAPRTRAG